MTPCKGNYESHSSTHYLHLFYMACDPSSYSTLVFASILSIIVLKLLSYLLNHIASVIMHVIRGAINP